MAGPKNITAQRELRPTVVLTEISGQRSEVKDGEDRRLRPKTESRLKSYQSLLTSAATKDWILSRPHVHTCSYVQDRSSRGNEALMRVRSQSLLTSAATKNWISIGPHVHTCSYGKFHGSERSFDLPYCDWHLTRRLSEARPGTREKSEPPYVGCYKGLDFKQTARVRRRISLAGIKSTCSLVSRPISSPN
jgi:hypothetical protein